MMSDILTAGGKIALVMLLLVSAGLGFLGAPGSVRAASTINLSSTWRFAADPQKVGVSEQWYAAEYDDSGWQTILSGQPWESQGVNAAGYAWYRQQLEVPAAEEGSPLTITLASITSDDDFYFNGVRVGGLKGEYKYNNRKLRVYTIPSALVRYGQPNTIAIRIWGGNIGFEGKKSGLVAGTYQAVLDRYQIMARPAGGAITEEVPVALWDLSAAQQGAAFELVYRFDPAKLEGAPAQVQYVVRSFAGQSLITGTASLVPGSDGITRAVIPVDAPSSQLLYLSGRFKIEWQFADNGATNWLDTGQALTVLENQGKTYRLKLYKKTFPAGNVSLPTGADPADHGMYTVLVSGSAEGLVLSGLQVFDTANAAKWSLQTNLQAGDTVYGDRTYTFASVPEGYAGASWIRTAGDSKSYKQEPLASFTINRQADVYVAIDTRVGKLPWVNSVSVDNLSFTERDTRILPEGPATMEQTSYGVLKLVDRIAASTPLDQEEHPYLEGGFTGDQKNNTPGSGSGTVVRPILGKAARESGYGWFAYRIGRGQLTPGKTYLLRIEYPEDKPRYAPIEIQTGQNYMDVGWKNGISSGDVYENWPLSHTWQFYDVVVPLGQETTASGGAGDGLGKDGFWVYFMNKIQPGSVFSLYEGGPAVASISLYEIDSQAHAPAISLPAGLPQRTLMFDWERQPTQMPQALVDYAKLMGYSAISPITLKWAFTNYGDPVAGYDSMNVDDANYWVSTPYTAGSGQAPAPAVPGKASVHQMYLEATRNSGVDYIPRFEYGGSYDLPVSARSVGADGSLAKPNRFANWGANLLHPDTWQDLHAYMDSLLQPYAADNPQLKGALWRIRSDRMQISYGPQDIALFCAETGTVPPAGLTDVQLSNWASTGGVGDAYGVWWQGKRAAFHRQLAQTVTGYRPDMSLYYYNWDQDKFSLLRPDLNQWAFIDQINAKGGAAAYGEDRAARAADTAADYIRAIREGDFTGPAGVKRPDYALNPSVYEDVYGMQLLAPANALPYADKPDYLNYFRTGVGLAVSNIVSYDEIGSRYINPKYETNMMTPAGGPFSMALELLAYYHGDARTLTYTAYTYGRGFADAHRRFAQAFRALPAVPGTEVSGTPADTKVRTYPTANGTYVGVAYKGATPAVLDIGLPGSWNASYTVTDLVYGQTVPAVIADGKLHISVQSGPMELNAYLIASSTLQAPQAPQKLTAASGNGQVKLEWTASSEAGSYQIKRSLAGSGPYTLIGSSVTGTTYTDIGLNNGTAYYYTVSAVNAGGESPDSAAAAAVPVPPPPAPSGLTVEAAPESALLSWSAVSGATGYTVKRSLGSGGPYVTVASGVSGTSYINRGLTGDIRYYYVVLAEGPGGESANSNEASALPLPVPLAPSNLTASPEIGRVQLNWTPVNSAVGYTVKRAAAGGSDYTVIASGVSGSSFTDEGLAAAMTYTYKVSAVNSAGVESPDSLTVSAAALVSSQASLASVALHDGYVTESKKDSGIGGTISSGTIRAGDTFTNTQIKGLLSFDTSGIPDGAILRSATLKLRRSGSITGTNPFETHGLLYADIKGGLGFSGSVALEKTDFEAPADAVHVAVLNDPVPNQEISQGTVNQEGLNLINKQGYTQFRLYFELKHNNDAGNDYLNWYPGDSSTAAYRPVLDITYDMGLLPTGLTAASGIGKVDLSWTGTGEAAAYRIKRSTTSGGPYTTIAEGVTGTAYTDTGLTNGMTYYYVVSAMTGTIESPNSAEALAVPVQ